jgi:hypothetical protein
LIFFWNLIIFTIEFIKTTESMLISIFECSEVCFIWAQPNVKTRYSLYKHQILFFSFILIFERIILVIFKWTIIKISYTILKFIFFLNFNIWNNYLPSHSIPQNIFNLIKWIIIDQILIFIFYFYVALIYFVFFYEIKNSIVFLTAIKTHYWFIKSLNLLKN